MTAAPMKVVLAFDALKGSLSATSACRAAAEALRSRWGARVEVVEAPMADGGEGSLELLQQQLGLETISMETVDAIGRPISAEYLFDAARGTTYIEVSRAAGLPQVSDVPLQPLAASSYGVGLLARDALARGAQELVVFLGGSATSDAGSGLLRALGYRFLDSAGRDLPAGGGALLDLDRVEAPEAHHLGWLRQARWVFVTDVGAPLTGPTGAARSYAPQKGASAEQVEALEAALSRVAEVLKRDHASHAAEQPGFGAAGGMALLPSAFHETMIVPGGRFFLDQLGVGVALQGADLVITGEGSFDAQSLDGKVVGTLAGFARQQKESGEPKPALIVLAGDVTQAPDIAGTGITAVFSLAEGPASLEELQADAAALIGRRAAEITALYFAGRPGDPDAHLDTA